MIINIFYRNYSPIFQPRYSPTKEPIPLNIIPLIETIPEPHKFGIKPPIVEPTKTPSHTSRFLSIILL